MYVSSARVGQEALWDFRAASQELTEHVWGDLPVEGPRTASWAVKYVAEHYGAPLARHARFLSDGKLGCQGAGVPEHYSLMQALQLAITVDQLQVGELACFEVLVRRSQMAELKHRAKFCPSVGATDDPYSDARLNMGVSLTRGMSAVSPAREKYVRVEEYIPGSRGPP